MAAEAFPAVSPAQAQEFRETAGMWTGTLLASQDAGPAGSQERMGAAAARLAQGPTAFGPAPFAYGAQLAASDIAEG